MASSGSAPSIALGTRKSGLARIQTEMVRQRLLEYHPEVQVNVQAMDSAADKDKITALFKMGDKNLWTGELESVLLADGIQGIVHSLKDVSTTLPANCLLGAILPREDPRDALVLPKGSPYASLKGATEIFEALPEGSLIGTSSLRRTAQLRRLYPQLRFDICRGNIDTRLRKLDSPEQFTEQKVPRFTALILAAAGLLRMGWGERISASLSSRPDEGGVLWAVGQGAIGIEVTDLPQHEPARETIKSLRDPQTWWACLAERNLMRTLEGGCSVPIGVETEWLGGGTPGSGWNRVSSEAKGGKDELLLRSVVVALDGSHAVEAEETATIKNDEDAERLGKAVAFKLTALGADKILADVNAERERQKEESAAKIAELKASGIDESKMEASAVG
jgi:hydroxymethylbilane synthase